VNDLRSGARVHVVGIGGAGMSGLARLLAEMGATVSGSDVVETPVLDGLRRAGIDATAGHDPAKVDGAEVVLWSPAIASDNVELLAAREQGSTMLSRSETLAQLGELRRIIGLTGTHGKTTATSMMVQVMHACGVDDGWLVGVDVLGVGMNGHWGSGDLILEVDESYGTFALLRPFALGLLNVEADHLDHYGSLDVLEGAFGDLVARTTGPVVVWSDDAGARRVAHRASRDVIGVGTSEDSDWRVSNVSISRRGSSFSLRGPDEELELALRVTGAHNVANAAVVAVLAVSLGVERDTIVAGLGAFQGAPRRFQFLGSWKGVDVYEDYAHLPGEIAATLAATRAAGYERVTAVFQPHRVTRTVSLAASFAPAFDAAEHVVVTDIYDAGEANPTGVTGELVADSVRARRRGSVTTYCSSLDLVPKVLESLHDHCDVIVLLGAGDVASIASKLRGGLR
jgi:UDP-N-acetylmuramate--alanine ligase